jgi:hypothetical protein
MVKILCKRELLSSLPSGEIKYQRATTPRIVLPGVGLDEALYPVVGKCSGKRDVRVVELLKQLLNCIPQVSVPEGSHKECQENLMRIR